MASRMRMTWDNLQEGFRPENDQAPPPHGPLQLSGAFKIGLSRVNRTVINHLDFHTAFKKWIGRFDVVRPKPGVLFGAPSGITGSTANLYHQFVNPFKRPGGQPGAVTADTRPDRKSLIPTRDATPPNPGRPEYGHESVGVKRVGL